MDSNYPVLQLDAGKNTGHSTNSLSVNHYIGESSSACSDDTQPQQLDNVLAGSAYGHSDSQTLKTNIEPALREPSHLDPNLNHDGAPIRISKFRRAITRGERKPKQRNSQFEEEKIAHSDLVTNLEQSVKDLQHALENRKLFLGPQTTDNKIYTDFEAILNQIRTWSGSFYHDGPISINGISQEILSDMGKVAPSTHTEKFPELLSENSTRRYFVQGWASLLIIESIFPPSSGTFDKQPLPDLYKDRWMEPDLANSAFTIEKKLASADRDIIPYRDLHDWRALTFTLLSKPGVLSDSPKTESKYLEELVERIISPISTWTKKEVELTTLRKDLLRILFDVCSMHKTLRRQRACWTIRPLINSTSAEGRLIFDEEKMIDKRENEESTASLNEKRPAKTVEIIISPGLFKRGNSNGDLFDVESCVKRVEVACV